MKQIILFDIDGVLVDVSNSYREAIKQTAEFFTNTKVFSQEIQSYKEKTGFNNDWDLTYAIIQSRGLSVSMGEVVNKFQELYLGTPKNKGLIESEKWLLDKKILENLSKNYLLGILTGRPKEEAFIALNKNKAADYFKVVIAMEDCLGKGKPNPFGLLLALEKLGSLDSKNAIYVGDSLDDIRAAKSAGVKPIGCMPPKNCSIELKEKMISLGAVRVINEVNEIEEVI